MADTVTSQLLENGPRNVVYKFTNNSDGTGETGVVKVNATSSGPLGWAVQGQTFYPGANLSLIKIKYSVFSMGLRIQWAGSPATDMLVLQATDHWEFADDRRGFGGITPPAAITATGNVLFTTVGAAVGSGYTVIMTFNKGIPQA